MSFLILVPIVEDFLRIAYNDCGRETCRWLDTLTRNACQTSGADVMAGIDKTRNAYRTSGVGVLAGNDKIEH